MAARCESVAEFLAFWSFRSGGSRWGLTVVESSNVEVAGDLVDGSGRVDRGLGTT